MKVKYKILLSIIVSISILCIFCINCFADFNTSEMVYTNSTGSYYLMRGTTETNEEFRIYVQKFNDNGIVDYVNQLSSYGLTWDYDVRNIDYKDVGAYVDVAMISLVEDYYMELLLDSITYQLYNNIDFDAFQKSKLCPEYTIYQMFNSGRYAYTSSYIDENNDQLTAQIQYTNTNGLDIYGLFSSYVYSLNECLYYNGTFSKNYSTDNNKIANHLYICQSESMRDQLCKSIVNVLYYEFGLTDYSYNDILATKWGYTWSGTLQNNVGQMIDLYETYYKNEPVYIFNNTYTDLVNLPNALQTIKNSFDLMTTTTYFNWIPSQIVTPIFTFVAILSVVGAALVIKKIISIGG